MTMTMTMALQPTRHTLRLTALIGIALLVLAPLASAGDATTARIEQQMSPEQFRAAGLDRLDAQQLGHLNAWLNRTLVTETTKAAQAASEQVKQQHRGFLDFGEPKQAISSRLVGEFRGFSQGRQYTLENGEVWKQTDAATLAGVRLTEPQVKITPGLIGNAWYLAVQGYNTRAKVERVK